MNFSKTLCFSLLATGFGLTVHAEPSLTVYNGNFALVKDDVQLELKKGINKFMLSKISSMAEPDSVILANPSGKKIFTILEQNYNAQPLSEGLLLNCFEGETIDFLKIEDNKEKIVKGKIIRSGYLPQVLNQYNNYGRIQESGPIVEIDGKILFKLPGTPLFPPLNDKQKELLKPSLYWTINSEKDFSDKVQLSYLCNGMNWEADYNLVMPEKGDKVNISGWVSINNQCGKDFENVKINLMAGNIKKLKDENNNGLYKRKVIYAAELAGAAPNVTEKAFDEYHLYSLANPVTLKDRETKQVEFVNASGIKTETLFVYDGMANDGNLYNQAAEYLRDAQNLGIKSNPNIWIMREFENSKDNGLGIPLPKGKLRFYKTNDDGSIEFVGENMIAHTPKDEKVRTYTGDAFDIKGERVRTSFKTDRARCWTDETFEIKLKNHKDKDVSITVIEHLFRWINWEIKDNSDSYSKKNSDTVEFKIDVPANSEKVIKYLVHYTW